MSGRIRLMIGGLIAASLAGCAARAPVSTPVPTSARVLATREGLASYYGANFHGKTAASGVRFDMNAMVAAHPSYPFGTLVRVTNLNNGRSVQVRVLDRGPGSGPQAEGIIIDLSRGAAEALDFLRAGRARVRLEVLRWGTD
jgi:rare lipoprotein A